MLSKTFGCEEVWLSMGVQGKGDTLMLNSCTRNAHSALPRTPPFPSHVAFSSWQLYVCSDGVEIEMTVTSDHHGFGKLDPE